MEGNPRALRISDCGLRIGRCAAPVVTLLGVTLLTSAVASAEQRDDPSVMHGAGQVVAGILFELPKTVIDATMTNPPVIGTAVGLLAGTARALQKTVGGLLEIAAGFDPWGAKRR